MKLADRINALARFSTSARDAQRQKRAIIEFDRIRPLLLGEEIQALEAGWYTARLKGDAADLEKACKAVRRRWAS